MHISILFLKTKRGIHILKRTGKRIVSLFIMCLLIAGILWQLTPALQDVRKKSEWLRLIREYKESLISGEDTKIEGYIEIENLYGPIPICEEGDSQSNICLSHLKDSSPLTGGEGSHCILTVVGADTSTRLFSDLDKLDQGDHFYIDVDGDQICYEIDQVQVVKAGGQEALQVEEGRDLCTLLAKTYGDDGYQTLARGHRVQNKADTGEKLVTNDGVVINSSIIVMLILILGIVVSEIILWFKF